MIEYIIETIICGAILYLGFWAFFRRSNNFKANRIVLLLSVFFFLLVPLIQISSENTLVEQVIENEAINVTITNISNASSQTIEVSESLSGNWSPAILISLYVIISALLLGRMGLNLYSILSGKFVAEKSVYKGQNLALVYPNIGPFTFFKTIYLNKDSFENGEIDDELILHESGHVKQLHSLDILFIELVQVFFWFNPFVFLFKKMIKTNHEYLADEFVVNSGSNIVDYSNKLINYSIQDKTMNLASGFNYSLIKNRLIMLSKYEQKSGLFYRLTIFTFLVSAMFLTTAAANFQPNFEKSGFFYADSLFWSGEDQKVYLKGDVIMKAAGNDVTGKGSFSFLGKVNLLIINDQRVEPNSTFDLSGMKCEINILSEEEAQEKYGVAGKLGAVEITTPN